MGCLSAGCLGCGASVGRGVGFLVVSVVHGLLRCFTRPCGWISDRRGVPLPERLCQSRTHTLQHADLVPNSDLGRLPVRPPVRPRRHGQRLGQSGRLPRLPAPIGRHDLIPNNMPQHVHEVERKIVGVRCGPGHGVPSPGGAGGGWQPGLPPPNPPTHPPTSDNVSSGKNEIYQRGPNLEVDFWYTTIFLASDPPPSQGSS